jgi:TrmH family RNA methyltransferase
MVQITSKNNKIYKTFQKLTSKKYRDKLGLYLIEGENLLEEALKNKAQIDTVLFRDTLDEKLKEKIFGEFSTLSLKADHIFEVEEKIFNELAQTETSQGVIASIKKPVFSPEDFIKNGVPGNFVVLDRLQDPGNIGTIIRTADAAAYSLVVCLKGTADLFSPKVVRSATGSLFRVPVIMVDSERSLLEFAKATGKKLVATCLDAKSYYYQENLKDNIGLIVGNEGNGISQSLIDASDLKIKIPMASNIESLNVAVAAAIVMYENMRQNY